ncbi:NAD-dependent epimerase/dehydratase family protein [Candidatus Nanohalococcus occultus]|uniref:NAD dependent epimerase/dehydratase n=1 Tax=Candidatus Nanohalococcus occultus TaxID=2978047 RepID=A0ABY8CEI5_9ARCH|nr:NAD dependent epimerase/dehydratase [Candidatus Nanohaloarchaeota archaeon SVXNc]
MSKKILITGASGTVGTAAAKHLASEGHYVIGVSRSVDENCYSECHQLDLLDGKDLERLEDVLEDVDVVFHLAWNVGVENFDTGEKWPGNMEMYENVLNAAAKAEVSTFINGSSIHAGTGSIPAYTVEASLEDTPEPYRSSIDPETDFDLRKEEPEKLLSALEDDPDSPYGESKVETEHVLREKVEDGVFELGVSIRIGGVNPEDKNEIEGEPYYPSLYWSHADLGRTVERIADSKEKGYFQFYGVSDNPGRIFSIETVFHPEN